MKILLFCSAFNGLSQRAWIELRALGHDVTVQLASDVNPVERTCETVEPDLIICPFLKDRVPDAVWRNYRTIIIHPGPMGDRGPSSLDWAIATGERRWGVTALQAVEEMDAGPIWATRTFDMPSEPVRKSALYNGPVADAAIELIAEVVVKATDPSFTPEPLDYGRSDVIGRLRPTMTQTDRSFSWDDPTGEILRTVQAADGSPGVRTNLCGLDLSIFDAQQGPASKYQPGSIVGMRHGAVLVATGDGSIWLGHAKRRPDKYRHDGGQTSLKLPAATILRDQLDGVPTILSESADMSPDGCPVGRSDVDYQRVGPVGIVTFDFYNGAMSTGQCRRLDAALRRAFAQDTNVVVLRGGETFSNGINLNVIEAAENPAREAWANINAIDDVCKTIITGTNQLIVASVGANAGAGGVMLALGADRVYMRDSAILNPHYATMGLFGSEYWSYTLPRRVGESEAERLTSACLPIGSEHAVRVGLIDRAISGSRSEFEEAVLADAILLATEPGFGSALKAKQERRERDERDKPLEAYRTEELGQMSRDMFDDRSGFSYARRAFVSKQKPLQTPAHLLAA
jgi:putative two-component system hydrogenase maturation factor HypX/HoxX